MLVMGSMIGSGIFIVSAEIARETDSPALLIAAWLVTGFMTIVAALSYGELAAMMPRAGGQYVYLREALGPLWGFLYGWTLFLVIQTGTIAAVGVAFGKFLGVFFPAVSSSHWILHLWKVPPIQSGPMVLGNMDVGINTQNLVAILLVILLSVVNIFGVKTGALHSEHFYRCQGLGVCWDWCYSVFAFGRNAQAMRRIFSGNFWRNAGLGAQHAVQVGVGGPIVMVGTLTILAVAQVGSLFSADAWNNVTFTAGEVKNPSRNLPLSLALGTGVVIALYIACNFIYLMCAAAGRVIRTAQRFLSAASSMPPKTAWARLCMTQMFGTMRRLLMAIAIMISSFGCDNGLILSGRARLLCDGERRPVFPQRGQTASYLQDAGGFADGADGLDLRALRFGQLRAILDYIIFAVLVFYILTIVGLFVLRRTRPDAQRPYRAVGYPVLPAIYIVMALFIDVVLLRYKPQFTWPGLIVVLLGIPVYFAWSRRARREARIGVATKEKPNEWQICSQPSR